MRYAVNSTIVRIVKAAKRRNKYRCILLSEGDRPDVIVSECARILRPADQDTFTFLVDLFTPESIYLPEETDVFHPVIKEVAAKRGIKVADWNTYKKLPKCNRSYVAHITCYDCC